MKKLLIASVFMMLAVSCHKSMEQRAADEAEEFTRRECPQDVAPDIVMDSMTYEKDSRTIVYCYTLGGCLDDKAFLDKHADEYERQFRQGILTMPAMKMYADKGFAFRYLYRSASTQKTLLDLYLRPSEQKPH